MIGFNDLIFKPHPIHTGGIISRYIFANGYGVSVAKSDRTYGGVNGLYELAIIDSNGNILYDTPIAKSVIGDLTEEMVSEIMKEVQLLIAD